MLKSAKGGKIGKIWQLRASVVGSFSRCLAPQKSVFLRQWRRRVCLGASRFEAGLSIRDLVGATGHSLVPRVGKLEVESTHGRYGESCVSL
ncbi:unnamed protein product [Prunus armeniaca]